MAIVPFLPLQLPWLFDALCGQNWPAGDEDALRRCAQYWDDALNSVGDLAGLGNDTSLGVLANVAAMSADEFAQYWSQYTGGGVKDSALGQLAAQCQAMVAALDGQANEVEYTKLTIDITIVLTAIQIVFAIAASVFSLGGSLTEIPLAVFIGRQSVLMLAGRFVQMVLMMVIPDLIAQGWMLEVDHTEASWDGSKTGAALENAVAGAVIGTLLGAGAAKLPFMGEEFGKTIGGKLVQGLGHFVEGGLTMDATTLATAGANYAWADAHGDTQTMQAIQQQLSGDALLRQFASGGLLAAAFYLPHLARPGGSPLTFSAEDGKTYTALLDDQALEHLRRNGTLPDGYTAKVYGASGVRAGTATFNGADVSIDRPLSDPLSADLTSKPGGQGGFQVTTHDGSTQRWGYPPSGTDPHPTVDGSVVSGDPGQADAPATSADQPKAQLLTYTKASDGNVPMPTINGVPENPEYVPPGSVIHYAAGDGPESARIYRVDFIDAKSGTVAVAQAERPGGTLQLTGTTQYEYGPAGIGKLLGVQGATYTAHNFADDGIKSAQVASSNLLTGKMTFGSPDLGRPPEQAAYLYQNAFGDRYNPFAPTTPAGASGFQQAGHEAPGAGGGFGPDGQGPVALLDGPAQGHVTSHDAGQSAVVEADAIVTGSTMASLAAHQAGDPVRGGDWAALGEQGEQGKPPVYGRPDTAVRNEGQAAADRKIEYHERFDRNPSPAGDEVKDSRSKYQEARSRLENEYLKKVSDLEGKPATSPEEGAALAAAREKAFDEYKDKLTNLAESHVRQEGDLLEKATKAAAQQEAELKAVSARIKDINSRKLTAEPAELKELEELRARIQEIRSSNPDGGKANQQAYQLERDRVATLYHEDVSSNLAAREKDLEDRRKSDLSQAYEHEEYRLTNEVSEKQAAARQAAASKADNSEELTAEATRLRNELPGKIAELSNRYYELQRGEAARSLRDSLLAEKAAIDDAASSASDPAFQLLLAKLDAIQVTPPADPGAERAAVMQAHEEYARALASARLEAIDQRLSELGPQDSPEAEYLRRMRAEAAEARDADVPVPGQSSPTSPPGPSAIRRTLADFRDSTPRAQAIDQAVGAVRDKLLNLPRSKVGAAGSLLIDGLDTEEFDVGDAGGEVPGPGAHLWTADGAVIEDRQQRYQAPGDRVVGSHPDRSTDAEAKLLSGVEARLQELREAGTEPAGALVIGSNKLICPSCQARLQEIGGKFPGIQVVVATDTESVVFDSYEAERNPAWVWGTRDVGQLKHVDVGMASSEAASSSPTEQVPLADVRRVEHDPAIDLSAALDPHGSPRQFETLARAIRQRAVDLQRVQAIIQDASGDLHWVEGGSKGMLSPGLAGIDMGAAGEADATGGRILLRTSDHMIDITDPAAAASLSPQEHWDRTVILPPKGNPVQLDWSARMDTLRSGVFLRPHDSPIDSRLTGPNLDAVTRVAGQEIVAAHGSEHGISIGGGEEITPEQAAAVLPQVKDTTIWNALICDFGTDGKAAALADATGATVRAADTTVFVNKAGQYVAQAPDQATGQPPAGPWKDYSPGGHETPAETISPLAPSRGDWASLGGHETPAPLPEVPGAVRAGEVAGSPPSWGSKAIVFSDNGKAMEYAEQAWSSAIDRLPPDQRAALLAYTGEAIAGSHEVSYQAVNRFLHGRIPETPEIRQAITLLDRAVRLQVVPEDVVVNRTTTADTFLGADGHRLQDPADLAGLIGSTQTSRGFTSTHFGTYNPGGEEVALHLMVPEGTPGIYLGTISHNPSEHELLLARGLSITIDRVWSEDGWSGTTWHVQAHVSAIDGHPVVADHPDDLVSRGGEQDSRPPMDRQAPSGQGSPPAPPDPSLTARGAGDSSAVLRPGSSLHVVDESLNPVPDWRAQLHDQIATYARDPYARGALDLAGGKVVLPDGTEQNVVWRVSWVPEARDGTVILDHFSVYPAQVEMVDGHPEIGYDLPDVLQSNLVAADHRAIRTALADELKAAGFDNGWIRMSRPDRRAWDWIRLYGDGERPAGYDQTIKGWTDVPPRGDGHADIAGENALAAAGSPYAVVGLDLQAASHPPPEGLTPVDPPAGWEHLRGSLFRSDSGLVVYDGSDYRMLEAAAHVHGDGTSFIVDLHAVDGVPQAGTHGDLTPEALASLMKEAGWDGQQRVILLACDTAGDGGFAARLASLPDMHGVEVVAADGRVWQYAGDSQVWIAGRTWSEEHQMWMPDPEQSGHWLAYQHDGTTLRVREVLPDTHGMPSQASADGNATADQPDLNGQGSAHSPPPVALDDLTSRGTPIGHGEPPLLAAPSPDVLRLDDRVIQGLPKGVLAYHDEVVVLEEHSDASGTYYQVAGDATMYHTPEDAMLSRLHGFANELRSLARAEGVPDELKARFREEAMAREHAAQRMRNAFENARRAAARAVEEEAKGPARAANAIKFRDREARYYQDATREYKAAMTHEAAAEALVRQASIPSRDERESLPPAAAALHVADQVIVVTSMRGEGDVRPALHPVVEELYEQARFELTSRISGLDGQIATVTDAGQRQQLEVLRDQLSDQLLQNGRCAEATGLSQWAKQLDEHLQRSDPGLTPTRRNQLILDALQQAHAESVAVDIRYGSGGSAVHGNPKEACANCAVAFKNAGITDLASQRPAVEPPPPGAALQYDPSHPGQQSLTASELAALFADRRNDEPPQVLRSWPVTEVDYVTGEAVNRADLPAQVALTPNEWTAALTAMVERIGTNPGLEYGLLSRVGPDGATTLILVEGGPTQVRPLDGTTLLAHSHPWFGSDRPSFGDFLQLRRKPFEFEYLIAPDGNGHEALVRFSRDGSWTRIATFEDGRWHLGEGHTIQGAAREGTFEAAREQRQEMRARATRLASARSSADLLATDPSLSPAERQEALAEVGRGLAELTGPAGQPSPFVPPELEQVQARLAAGADLTPAEVAVAREHLAAHEAVAKAEAVTAGRQARLTVPGLVARAEDAGAYLNRLWLNDRRPGLIASAIGEDKNAQGGGTTARIDFNHQALVNDIYAAVRDAIRDLPDAPGITELMTRVVEGLGADPKAFSDALVVLRDNGIKGLGHAGLTEAQRVLVADTLDLVTTWQETLHDVAAGKHVPEAPRRDLTLPLPGPALQAGTALAGLPADAGQPRDPLRFPDRITPGELARRMPEFRDQQYQARTDLTLLQQAMDRVSAELDQATLDAASGIPGAGTRVTALRQELDQLSQHEQTLRQDLGEFTKKLWATRDRFGLRPDPRDMEPTDPALHHVRDVQRLYSRDHGLPGRAWMGSPPLVPGPELLGGALEVGHAEIPFMERVKRLVSLSGALEEAVRKGEVTPLLPDVVKQQFDAVRAAPRQPDADPALLAARISVLRERVQQLAAYKRLDAPLQSYVDRLIDEAHHEAQQVLPVPHEGTRLPAQAGHASGDSWLDGAKHAAAHPLNATTRNIEGDLVFRLLRTPDGGFYAQFSKVLDLYKIEENQFGAARLTLLDQSLLEHPLTRLGPVDLGVVAGVSMKYALTHGVEFSQSLDRGDAIAIKIWGPGKRVIVTSWDRMPTDRQGQPLITTDVRPVNKHTIKTDLAVSPALFVPGAKAMELPAEAKLSLEVSAGPRRGGGVEWKVQGTAEFVAQSPDFRKAGISAAMDWLKGLGYPGWAPSPESSTEATLVLGPIEFHKLPQAVRQQIANHFASRGVTITEEGTIPEDQVRQLTGVPVPPQEQPSAIFGALNPPLAARPATGGQVLPLGPAPSADDQRVLPFNPVPSADDPRLLPFGPAPSADDRRVLPFGPAPSADDRRVLGDMEEGG